MAGQNPQAVANLLRNIYESQQYQTNAPAPFQHQGFAVTNWLGLTGHNSVPHQLAAMFDPRTRAGLVNLASLFTPGGGEFMGPGGHMADNPGMPGMYEPYSMGKAATGGQFRAGSTPSDYLEAVRSGQKQHAHDLLFGGEVHARGAIPKRPAFNEPPKDTASAIANKLGISRERVQAQMQAAERHNQNVKHEQIIARVLRNHGLVPYKPKEAEATDISHTRSIGQRAHAATNIFHPALKAQRQAALRDLLKAHFNHRT